MNRNLSLLENKQFDVLVIGGGIYGVCTAWDAALRGLSVALIEKSDFGAATSSNSLKIIHGGLRYLQHGDLRRMRESISERRVLMGIAPHLVHPLKCVMPTYGHALRGKEVMSVALFLNDLVGFDRNRHPDPGKRLPRGKVLSKEEALKYIPGLDPEGLTGAALWYDCQLSNSERMLFSILQASVQAKATVANYLEMVDFLREGSKIKGVCARDALTGREFNIGAQIVVNNSGPWVNSVLEKLNGRLVRSGTRLSAAMNLVVKRKLFPDYAVGVWSPTSFSDEDAIVSKGSRLFFVTPWQESSIIGTTHEHYSGPVGSFRIEEPAIRQFIADINEALPSIELRRDEVAFVYSGMLPIDDRAQTEGHINLLKEYRIIDHAERDELEGLLTVVGVKYTTARDVARKTVDKVLQILGKEQLQCLTDRVPVMGGNINVFDEFLEREKEKHQRRFEPELIEHLVRNHGSQYERILRYGSQNREWLEPLAPTTNVVMAEVIHAIREEMAIRLSDVIRRRTILGAGTCPDCSILTTVAETMAKEMNWTRSRVHEEIEETRGIYS